MHPSLIIALFLALLSIQAFAGSDDAQYNRVSLNESAQIEVDNDLLVVVMFAQAEGRDAAAPADEVNRRMDWAVNMAKSHPEVKVQTLGYQTSPLYNKSTIRGWRVNQSLRLESRDGRLLGDLVGRLQEQLQVQSIAYQVSEGQRREQLDGLTAQALARFQDRAAHIAKTLGRSGYRVVRININDGRHSPMPIARGMMMEASADVAVAPPRLEAGTQQMSVSINGEIELSEQ
ncbi:MAG: SIMPL domain-containing protein [Sedimenticolaceae bacterium]|jgi:predicted secreted protein